MPLLTGWHYSSVVSVLFGVFLAWSPFGIRLVSADPSWTPLFSAVSAVVVDVGATISHAVIVARELGVPCVTSATNATSLIPDGALIEVNGSTGTVTILE